MIRAGQAITVRAQPGRQLPLCSKGADFREAEVAQGVILLALIAAFFALLTTRVRRRMGMSVSGRTWIVAMVVVVLIVLALWDGSSR
jgi:hypothetical protein